MGTRLPKPRRIALRQYLVKKKVLKPIEKKYMHTLFLNYVSNFVCACLAGYPQLCYKCGAAVLNFVHYATYM